MAAEEGADPKLITLLSSEGHEFQVREKVAFASPTIKQLIEEGRGNRRIALPKISSHILQQVIAFAESHSAVYGDLGSNKEVDGAWGKELKSMKPACITRLILAADYLELEGLLHLACQRAAELMAGRTAEEVEKMFHLKCEVTPAEEEEIKKKNKWAFE